MALSVDPRLRHLDDCACCHGVTAETPVAVSNRAGLDAVAHRVGTHTTFKETMLSAASASGNVVLRGLQTRDGDDFTIALTDAWAMSLDVLTFYQERLANESYLRTATERFSVAELARLIGYQPSPGVAASTHLAFTMETAPGAPEEVALGMGVKVQSIPGQDETPQLFETVEAITARPTWNAMPARKSAPEPLSVLLGSVWLRGTSTNLKTGDQLLIFGGEPLHWAMRRVAEVTADDAAGRTKIDLEPLDYWPLPAPPDATAGVFVLRTKAAPFGHNAPLKPPPDKPADIENATEWEINEADEKSLSLDAVYEQVRPGSWLVIERSWFWIGWTLQLPPGADWRVRLLRKAGQVGVGSRATYGLTGRVTQLTLDAAWLDGYEWSLWWLRNTAVFARSEELDVAEAPLLGALPPNAIPLDGGFGDLPLGRSVVVSGRALGAPVDSPVLRELGVVKSVSVSGGVTTLTLETNLTTVFDRQTAAINANVALATHGETIPEVLGSGDAQRTYQQFTMRGSPLTYRSAATPAGVTPELEVRVSDLLWQPAATLYGRGPSERVYVLRQGDDGRTTVQFGDGVTGARLPTGSETVRARYRKGLGKGGNVKPGQLSLLMSRPLGLKEAMNPVAAEGGADAEPLDQARQNAPLTVLTLDRVVSIRDYEDFARAFAGVSKALATWTWDGQAQGIVLTIAGEEGAAISSTSETYIHLVAALRQFGDPNVPLRVQSYVAKAFVLQAVITKGADAEATVVEGAAKAALLAAFSFERRRFGQAVALSEVMATLQGVPGVVGVDLDQLHREDNVGGGGHQARLPAFAPRPGSAINVQAAELLTLAETGITLAVQ